jgi:hypothetical protein
MNKSFETAINEYKKQAGGKEKSPVYKNEYEEIFKRLRKLCHPDLKGHNEIMVRLNKAREKCEGGDCDELLAIDKEFEDLKNNPLDITI